MTDFVNGTLVNGSTYAQTFARIGSEHIGLFTMGVYGQDQWRISPVLTMTLALRVEVASNPNCARNCFDGLTSTFHGLNHDPAQPYNSAILLGQNMLSGILVEPWPSLVLAWLTH